MNIFVLDLDPKQAARYHCDVHVNKMIVESAQILSTVHRDNIFVQDKVYKPTHINRPCEVWAGMSEENYDWLYQLFRYLTEEFFLRFCKRHMTYIAMREHLRDAPPYIRDDIGLTAFAQVMPKELRDVDAVVAYRRYYLKCKRRFLSWTSPAKVPDWVIEGLKSEYSDIHVSDKDVYRDYFFKQHKLILN
jgi:hypothetical protein